MIARLLASLLPQSATETPCGVSPLQLGTQEFLKEMKCWNARFTLCRV